MGKNQVLAFLLAATLIIGSCRQSSRTGPDFSSVSDADVVRVLSKALESAGGWVDWQDIRQISYVKKSILYHPDGTTESEVNQVHRYLLQPQLKGSITWRDSLGNHEILYGPDGASKLVNGSLVADGEKAAEQSFLSAVFVLFQPFKLLDPGAQLSYLGVDTLDTGRTVETIRAQYDPDAYDNHSTADVWYFYFDVETGQFLANMVYHAPTYAYIENNEFTDEHPIRLNTYRESWRVDGERNKQYLRGVFFYGNYVVE